MHVKLQHVAHTRSGDKGGNANVGIFARDAAGTPAETAADALVAAVFARVMAEQTCGGLAIKIDAAGIAADGDEADTALCAMHALFDVVHRTPRTSITHTP